jgi:hypothetical protein
MWKKPGQPTGKYRDWDEIEGKRAARGRGVNTCGGKPSRKRLSANRTFSQSAPECLRFRNESSLGFNDSGEARAGLSVACCSRVEFKVLRVSAPAAGK